MISSASASARIAPEIIQASKELKIAQKQDEDSRSTVAESEAASPRQSKPAHEGVGQMVNVEA